MLTRSELAGFEVCSPIPFLFEKHMYIFVIICQILLYHAHGMQQPISETKTILVSQNLVNWFLNPVSKVIALHAMLKSINSIHVRYVLKVEFVF